MGLKKFVQKKMLPLYQDSVRKLHELKYIFFELTNNCNLSCLHCGSDCVKSSKVPDLAVEDVIKVLNEIKTVYDPHNVTVVLSGGEPLVYPQVFELGRKIYELEFPWGMVTNGYSWDYNKIIKAKKSGMQSVTISLDGLENEHNWLRGNKNSFERAVNAIKLFIENPFYQVMDVITCVNKRTINQLDDIYKFIKSLGVTRWRLFTIAPIGRAVNNKELFLDKDEHLKLYNKIIELKDKKEISVNYAESDYLGKKYEHEVRDFYYFCLAGINIAGVMVNGDILACPNIDRRFKQGNIHTDSFIDTWENKYQVFRDRSWMKKGLCENCKEWNLCRGNSFHLWDLDKNQTKICHMDFLDL